MLTTLDEVVGVLKSANWGCSEHPNYGIGHIELMMALDEHGLTVANQHLSSPPAISSIANYYQWNNPPTFFFTMLNHVLFFWPPPFYHPIHSCFALSAAGKRLKLIWKPIKRKCPLGKCYRFGTASRTERKPEATNLAGYQH